MTRRTSQGSINSLGHNLIGNTSGSSGWVASDQLNTDPLLNPPANNGGPTPTQSLQLSSPAIAMGNCNIAPAVTTDQRGVARKTPACDVGAYEAAYDPVVRNTRDFGGGSLRYAVTYATPGTDITFDPAVFSGSFKVIVLAGGGLTLPASLTISGPGATLVGVFGNHAGTVFTIPFGVSATISGLTITQGSGGTSGGGIDNAGTLTLANSSVIDNSANTGGGLRAHGGAVSISGCTFDGNSALTGYGGGLYTNGPLTVSNSTFNNNSAHAGGGGLYVNATGSLTVANSTVAGNTTPGYGGGTDNYNGPLNLGSSIVSGNSAGIDGPDIAGAVTSLGNNLVTDFSGSSGLAGTDLVNVDPLLGALIWNGGPTRTMSLGLSSPAIGMGNCNLGAPAAPVSSDQRGSSRKTRPATWARMKRPTTRWCAIPATTAGQPALRHRLRHARDDDHVRSHGVQYTPGHHAGRLAAGDRQEPDPPGAWGGPGGGGRGRSQRGFHRQRRGDCHYLRSDRAERQRDQRRRPV